MRMRVWLGVRVVEVWVMGSGVEGRRKGDAGRRVGRLERAESLCEFFRVVIDDGVGVDVDPDFVMAVW